LQPGPGPIGPGPGPCAALGSADVTASVMYALPISILPSNALCGERCLGESCARAVTLNEMAIAEARAPREILRVLKVLQSNGNSPLCLSSMARIRRREVRRDVRLLHDSREAPEKLCAPERRSICSLYLCRPETVGTASQTGVRPMKPTCPSGDSVIARGGAGFRDSARNLVRLLNAEVQPPPRTATEPNAQHSLPDGFQRLAFPGPALKIRN